MADRLIESAVAKSRGFFDTLNAAERAYALEVLRDMVDNPELSSLKWDWLWEADYWMKPPKIEEFLDSEEYAGVVTQGLYPQWREDLCHIFAPGSGIYEWVLRGAIGSGKSTAAALAFTYSIVRVACLRDPHAYYQLMPNSRIVFGIYAITKTQVADVGYFKVRDFITSCPWFEKKCPINPRLESRVDFKTRRMQVLPGSRAFHAIGLDMFSFYLDEANFMQRSKSAQSLSDAGVGQAMEIYNNACTRLKSRFLRPGGLVPGLMILISSERGAQDFMPQHLQAVQEEVAQGHVHVSNYSQWEVKKSLMSGKKFRVQIGDAIYPSRVLAYDDSPSPNCQVISVPVEYRPEFVRDVDQAIRDIAGIPTTGISPFIRDKTIILNCCKEELHHPFTREELTLDFRSELSMNSFFLPEALFRIRRSSYVARRHPNAPRFVHVDLSLSGDCAGIAMGHVAEQVRCRRSRGDGTYYDDVFPMVEIDFMVRIRPPEGSETGLAKIREFILSLRDQGAPILRVSFDGYMSADSKQLLLQAGVDTTLLSVDRTEEPYLHVRQAMIENRISYCAYRPFITEMSNLERDLSAGKIDHPAINPDGTEGSKDVSDAVAGVVYHCMTDIRALSPLLDHPGGVEYDTSPEGVALTGGVLTWHDLDKEAE